MPGHAETLVAQPVEVLADVLGCDAYQFEPPLLTKRKRTPFCLRRRLSIFLFRENLQESDGQMPLFSCFVRTVERKTRETLGF
jgi:hypothetical protein